VTTGANVLRNGGFEAPDTVFPPDASWRDDGWSTYFFNPSVDYGRCDIVSGGSPEGSFHARCAVNTVESGAQGWHFLLSQTGFPVSDGRTYELEFRVRASASRLVEVSVQHNGGAPYTPGGNVVLMATSSWTVFRYRFRASLPAGGTDPSAKLAFWLLSGGTSSAGTVEFDDVRLRMLP